jgi:AcrR family transcriptional regulator
MSDNAAPLPPLRLDPQPVASVGKAERTRAAILNAALNFLWSHPFRDMTVATLMASAGASRPAFYQYFRDLHEVMETLLVILRGEILEVVDPWVAGVGDPVALLRESIDGLVHVCYHRGPLLRAVTDAAVTDQRLEEAWREFVGRFDDAVCARIEADQAQGLIAAFAARPVAVALNRLDAQMLIEAFGRHPRERPEPVRDALARIWISTLYGAEWLGGSSPGMRHRS